MKYHILSLTKLQKYIYTPNLADRCDSSGFCPFKYKCHLAVQKTTEYCKAMTGSRWWLQVLSQKKWKCNLKQDTQLHGGQNYKDWGENTPEIKTSNRVFIFPSRLFPGHPKNF